jgi:hypothetical protein
MYNAKSPENVFLSKTISIFHNYTFFNPKKTINISQVLKNNLLCAIFIHPIQQK